LNQFKINYATARATVRTSARAAARATERATARATAEQLQERLQEQLQVQLQLEKQLFFSQKLNRKNLGEQLLTLVNAFVNFALLRPSWSRFGVRMTGFPKIPPSRPPSSAEIIDYHK
jgi:hypothetical protein